MATKKAAAAAEQTNRTEAVSIYADHNNIEVFAATGEKLAHVYDIGSFAPDAEIMVTGNLLKTIPC